MGFIPFVLMGVGSMMSAGGTFMQSRSQADAMETNADIMRVNAQAETYAWAEKERAHRRKTARELSAMTAQVGAAGVELTASPLDVLVDQAYEAEKEALAIRHQGRMQSWKYLQEAENLEDQADSTRTAGLIGAGASLLAGIGNAGAYWWGSRQKTPTEEG